MIGRCTWTPARPPTSSRRLASPVVRDRPGKWREPRRLRSRRLAGGKAWPGCGPWRSARSSAPRSASSAGGQRRRGHHHGREAPQGRAARGGRQVKPDEQGQRQHRAILHPQPADRLGCPRRTLAWGMFGYTNMPKRKDPDIPVRVGLAIAPWPGISSDKVEQLVTRKIEQAATGNYNVDRVESTTQDNMSVVLVRLLDSIENTDQEFQDIGQRLSGINDLPEGAGPITLISDFGDTAALMLTMASPPVPRWKSSARTGLREPSRCPWRSDDRADDPAVLLSRVGPAGRRRTTARHVRRTGPPRRHRTRRPPGVGWQLLQEWTRRPRSPTPSSAPRGAVHRNAAAGLRLSP